MHQGLPWFRRLWVVCALFIAYPLFCAGLPIQFTHEEQLFLETHNEVRIGVDPKFVPFEFFTEEGVYSGISAAILELVSERTGLKFIPNPQLDWLQAVQGARDRTIDVLPAVGFTTARAQFMTFLEPHLQFQRSIVVQSSNLSISSFTDLLGRQVAVQRDSSHEGFLLEYPEIHARLYDTVEAALLAVNRGEEVAFVGNEATSAYMARRLGLTELRFIAVTEGGVQNLHMAVRSDWPQLASILQKALDSISDNEYDAILNRWIQYETQVDYSRMWRMLASIAVAVLILVAISIFWILRLRKAVKEKDLAQQQAHAADMEKGRFMARISHEIRTPLNGIRGMSYLLEKTHLDQSQLRYLHTIKSATQTMQVIINDILEYSRIEEGRITLEAIPFTMDEVLQNSISIESWLIRQKGLDFQLIQDDTVPQFVIGDPTRIKQILTNLLHNAVKFTSEGGIEFAVSSKPSDPGRCIVVFSIRDTGIGMSPAQMAEMFKPFVQANETITRKYGGTGLGLSIVKNLVEQMGGSIEVQSEVGKGSVFRVDLPLKVDVAGSEEEKVRRKSISFSSLRALMVLNDGLLIDRVNTMFKEYHIHIDGVSSLKLASGIMKDGQGYDLLAIEVDRLSAIPAEFVQALVAMGERKPKVLVFIHDEGSLETEGALQNHCDIILPLPIVNSVSLNALLQLFGTGQTPARVSQQMEKLGRSEPMNVLVVEDNLTNQLIARELLERTGCTVFVANNGKQGLEVFLEKEALIDVVLMDLHMDVMDGYEATTLIRQKNPTVPILVLSADVMESVRERCIRSGATDLIGKPYDPDVMVAKVFEVGTAYKHAVNDEAAIDADLGLKQAGGDRHVYALILDAFVTETRGTIADLKAAIRSGDFPAAAELAHTCKGGCGAVGATKTRKLCSELQEALNEKRFTPEHALVKELFDEMDRVLDQAQRYRE